MTDQTTPAAPRGIRNNNPGNIKELRGDSTQWVGERATDDDPLFEEFETPEDGIRALVKILRNYKRLYNISMVSSIITRWAPSVENDTKAYIRAVCERMCVSPFEDLDMDNRYQLRLLAVAIIHHENGMMPYSPEQLAEGVDRAFS